VQKLMSDKFARSVMILALVYLFAGCGGGYSSGTPSKPNNPSTPSTLAIVPGQVVSGVIDQNGGAASNLTPYLLVATGGNVGVSGYTWTVPTGSLKAYPPAIVIHPFGVVDDVTPQSLTQGTFTMAVEVSDGTTTVTSQATVDLSSVCNSSSGNSSNPCSSSAVTNQHNPYLPNGTVGSAYAATIVTSGGTAPYTWVLGGGHLPPGIAIDQAKGILRGTPTTAGTYYFYVLTTDAAHASTSSEIGAGVLAAQFTLAVN
jgi:large repetitive protein